MKEGCFISPSISRVLLFQFGALDHMLAIWTALSIGWTEGSLLQSRFTLMWVRESYLFPHPHRKHAAPNRCAGLPFILNDTPTHLKMQRICGCGNVQEIAPCKSSMWFLSCCVYKKKCRNLMKHRHSSPFKCVLQSCKGMNQTLGSTYTFRSDYNFVQSTYRKYVIGGPL